MKDYLGQELRKGDYVATMVNIKSGGTYFVTAKIIDMTRTRVYLGDWSDPDVELHKEYTMPLKCIRVLPK